MSALVTNIMFVMLSLIVIMYLYMTRKFKYWKNRGVMELPPTPFLGNFGEALMLKKSPGYFTKELYDAGKGRAYMGFYIFDTPFFLVRDPMLIKHILVKDFNYFSDRYVAPDPSDHLGASNLFVIKNPAWKLVRSKLSPIYTSGRLRKMFELMIEVGKDLDTHLSSAMGDGKELVIEMKELWAKYMTDMIATTAFGLKVNSLNNPNAEFRKYGKKIFDFTPRRGLEFLTMFFLPHMTKWVKAKVFVDDVARFLRSVFWETIEQRIKSGTTRNDLIDLLIELRNTDSNKESSNCNGFKFEGDNLLSQAAVFFNAGFETSSSLVSFTLYEISIQPELQNKLRKEILQVLENNDGQITYDSVIYRRSFENHRITQYNTILQYREVFGFCYLFKKQTRLVGETIIKQSVVQIKSLTYLDMVTSETLRKYPPLPFLDRVATADYKIPNSDLIIEKGTPVYIPMLGLHYDPEHFPRPEKYDPERFSEENKKNIKQYTYFPFGEGPHICIGARLGLLQSKLGLIQILSNYEVSVCEETEIPLKIDPKGVTTTSLGGLYLKLRNLNDAGTE